jgi:hypothetical protein
MLTPILFTALTNLPNPMLCGFGEVCEAQENGRQATLQLNLRLTIGSGQQIAYNIEDLGYGVSKVMVAALTYGVENASYTASRYMVIGDIQAGELQFAVVDGELEYGHNSQIALVPIDDLGNAIVKKD